jgi:hypothetical protein
MLGFLRQRKKRFGDSIAFGDLIGRDTVILDDKKTGLLQRLANG